MVDRKLITVIKQLHKKTLAGKIFWEATVEADVYQASFPGSTIKIFPQGADYVVMIYNDEGVLIEEVNDTDFDPDDFGDEDPYAFLDELYSMARRRALGVDEALDSLLDELEAED